jgi:AcrR family transcriptional regulator
MPQRTRTKARRYTRTEWLAKALELLAEEGGAKPHIETLCHELKVTRGSFYWHFRSRAEFVRALVDYWAGRSRSRSSSSTAVCTGHRRTGFSR